MSDNQTEIFDKINAYFDHIYVLTIQRAFDRHQLIRKQLIGLNYSFFFGTDKQLTDAENLISKKIYDPVLARYFNRYNKEMKIGEIACSLGHKAIYEDILQNQYKKVLILEDDVVVNHSGLITFQYIEKELPLDWDLLYLDYNKHTKNNLYTSLKKLVYHIQKYIGLLKWTHKTISNLFARPYSVHLKKAGYHDFTSAYAITRKAAEKLFELQSPVCFPSDHLLAYAVTNEIINGYISTTKIFAQQSQQKQSGLISYVE